MDAYADMVKDCGAEMMSYFRVAAGMAEGDKVGFACTIYAKINDGFLVHNSKFKGELRVPNSKKTWNSNLFWVPTRGRPEGPTIG